MELENKNKKITTGLGKGLGALIPNVNFEKDNKGFSVPTQKTETENSKSEVFDYIELKKIVRNPYQPRHDFDIEALTDLKNSILQHGVIQPITVRKVINGYELISGERRFRASTEAGLEKIPAYILDIQTGEEMLEIAIIENLQREDLNPVEVAFGYQRLMDECKLTQEQVALKVGKNRSTVTNFLRILRLPESVHELIRNKKISMGHARTLLALENKEEIILAANKIIEEDLSVRATELLVKELSEKEKNKSIPKEKTKIDIGYEVRATLDSYEDKLRHIYGTEVKIKTKSMESGSIEFEFYSPDDLNRIIELLETIREEN